MHHTYMFVNFVAIDASLHQTYKLQDIFFIFSMLQLTFRLASFQKYASRCYEKHIFAKRILALPIKHITLLPPERLQEEPFLPIWLALVLLLVVRIAIFPLFDPFGILIFAHYMCIFSLRNPVSSNDYIHHTCKSMNFVCHLLFSLYFYCRIHPPLCKIADFS